MIRNKKLAVLSMTVLSIGTFLYIKYFVSTGNYETISINGQDYTVEIANTEELRLKGLSGKSSLEQMRGMIFDFNHSSISNCFWMKDMLFSIDMIWLNDDKKIVSIEENVPPSSYPNTFCPKEAAKYGLELKSGTVEEKNIKVGMQASF